MGWKDIFKKIRLVDFQNSLKTDQFGAVNVKIENKNAFFLQGYTADLVLCNPPFTRGSRLLEEEKRILAEFSKKEYGLVHGWKQWNLYASFLLLCPKFLPERPNFCLAVKKENYFS